MSRTTFLMRHAKSGARTRKSAVPQEPGPFESVDDLLEAARQTFLARKRAADAREELERGRDEDKEEQRALLALEREARAWTSFFHRSFSATGDKIELCARCRTRRLNRLEREILVGIILFHLALVESHGREDCGDVLCLLQVPGTRTVKAMRCMSERGRLHRAGLIGYEDEDDDLRQRTLLVDPVLLDGILYAGKKGPGIEARSERELYTRLSAYTATLCKKADAVGRTMRGMNTDAAVYRYARKARSMRTSIEETLARHPDWALSRVFADDRVRWNLHKRTMFLALVGKELGHVNADDDLFQGGGLARAAARKPGEAGELLGLLRPGADLVRAGLVQPAGGEDFLVAGDPASIEKTEFELTEKSIELLGIDRKLIKKRDDLPLVRPPAVRMEQLVLSERVRRALAMALAQSRHAGVLIDSWGMGEILPYGRAVTLLFSGPPGVGKTACAEAMAHQLSRPVLVADYAQIENCYVGQTEKNIVRTFRAARKAGAVLFWDEADAVFYSRDQAARSWEVRDVNVLLQQLERFEGVCVLATNRKVSLDPALERRITLKIEFDRPDRAMRRAIWRRLLPQKMPLSADVDLARLSEAELTGGEIKNAVLNAARLALARGPEGPVTMDDLLEAVRMETGAKWSGQGEGKIGFVGG